MKAIIESYSQNYIHGYESNPMEEHFTFKATDGKRNDFRIEFDRSADYCPLFSKEELHGEFEIEITIRSVPKPKPKEVKFS